MSDLISRNKLIDRCKGTPALKNVLHGLICVIEEQPTVEAFPKSYVDQLRWERDIAISQLEELGLSLGEKVDRVKELIGVNGKGE